MNFIKFLIKTAISIVFEILLFPLVLFISILARFSQKSFDIGLGPDPLINNIYHKKALIKQCYKTETFVNEVYFITDEFDIRADQIFRAPFNILRNYYLFTISIFRYRCIYIYFNGGALGFTKFLWKLEPFFYKLAGVKVVIMPYGGDVQDMSRSPNLLFKNTMSLDYPGHRKRRQRIADKIDLWTKYADHIISGCEWVDYMYHWDTLMLAHFSIDTEKWQPIQSKQTETNTLKILHAPNHRNIKGTQYFIKAVKELKEEGLNVELILIEKVPNSEIQKVMSSVDLVADQLVVGWYAMFALEAMCLEKPVLCYIREDLENLYIAAGLIEPGEIPIIKCDPLTVKEVIRDLVNNRKQLLEIKQRSRQYVLKHHSLEAVGKIFRSINESLEIKPSSLN